MIAMCDPKTGFFEPVQTFPNGRVQCFSPNGTKTSELFVDDGLHGPIPPKCLRPVLLQAKTAPAAQAGPH